jgi:TnpA family transposase
MSGYLSRYIGADRLPRNLSDFDIEIYFRLPAETIQAIKQRSAADRHPGAENRLVALATQIVFLRTTGRTLDNVAALPVALLKYIGTELGVPAPSIASLRSMYQRRATATTQQAWAREHLGLKVVAPEILKELEAVLSAQAGEVVSTDELVTAAFHWLFERKVVIPGDRTIRDIARDAFAHVEQQALEAVRAAVPKAHQKKCRRVLFEAKKVGTDATVLQWFKTPPRRHSPSTINETLEKIRFLKDLNAHEWDLSKIPLARQKAYAQAIANRPPSDSKKISDDLQLVETICFLRMVLLELTDSALYQTNRRISGFSRDATAKTQIRQARRSGDYRECLVSIRSTLNDSSQTPEARLVAIEALINTMGDLEPNSHAAIVREVLTDDSTRVHSLLTSVADLAFRGRRNDAAIRQLDIVRGLHEQGVSELPSGIQVPVNKIWKKAIEGEDRKHAFKALEACTALSLRRGIRRGSVWVDHSLTYCERDQMLIPLDEWERDKARYLKALGLTENADEFLVPQLALLEANLQALAEAIKAGVATIDDSGILHLPALRELEQEVEPEQLRDLIFKKIGDVQFPDLILEIDAETNFSEMLLGRRAKDDHELIALYAALISHGTEMDAKTVSAMIPQLDPGHVSTAMRALESPGRMTKAIKRIVEFQSQHKITRLWGSGELASSDMMSIDTTRNLWNARVDPRRRTYAVGVYTHVTDHHGIVYNQPIVLNERQAGPAIEGAVQYNTQYTNSNRLKRLAVDTHGYTYVGMTFAKLLGFDLCPQLRDLKERKLFLPRGVDTPEGLGAIVVDDVSLLPIRKHWDELLRMVASIFSGRVSAAVLLQRMGSAAQGDPVHRAADQLGRLLRTIFLCDYFSNLNFRREVHTILNRGESVHQLQRVVHTGKIAPQRGRRRDELIAISGAHTLLTNLVIAWNTHRMQGVVDQMRKGGIEVADDLLARMGPAHFSHINFRGLFNFLIERYRESLLNPRYPAYRRTAH